MDYWDILLSDNVILFVPSPFGFRCRVCNAKVKYSYSTLKELLAKYWINEKTHTKWQKKHDT